MTGLTTQKDLVDIHKKFRWEVVEDVVPDVGADNSVPPVGVGAKEDVSTERSSPKGFCQSSVAVEDKGFWADRSVL